MPRRGVPRVNWATARRRIGSSDAISWPLLVAFYPLALLFTLYGSGIPYEPAYLPHIFSASVISSTCTVLWLLLAKWLIFRRILPKRTVAEEPAHPFLVLAAVLVALVIRAVVIDALFTGWGLTDEVKVFSRFVGSLPSSGVMMITFALLVPAIREYANSAARIEQVETEFAELEATADARLEEERRGVIELARVGLDERLRTIAGEEPPETLARVRGTIEELVRPLSHRLGAVDALERLGPETKIADPPGFVTVVRSIVDRNPFRPIVSALWVGLTVLVTAPLAWGQASSALFAVAAFAVVLVVTWGAGAAWDPFVAKLTRGKRVLLYTLTTLCIGLLIGFFGHVVSPDLTMSWLSLEVIVTLVAIVIGWLFAAAFTLFRHAASLRERRTAAEDKLRTRRAELNAVRRSDLRALARILHGPMQDALSVASFRLHQAVAAGSAGGVQELLPEVRRSLGDALAQMSEVDRAALPVEDALAQLAELWEGLVDISWDIEPGAAAMLAAHTATRSGFNEIAREAVSNAVRHGAAEAVAIRVNLDGADTAVPSAPAPAPDAIALCEATHRVGDRLRVEINASGSDPDPAAAPGFGAMLLDELTLDWSREARHPGVRIVAVLPLVS